MEWRVNRVVLIGNDPGNEEVHLIMFPQILEFLLIILQEDEIDHL